MYEHTTPVIDTSSLFVYLFIHSFSFNSLPPSHLLPTASHTCGLSNEFLEEDSFYSLRLCEDPRLLGCDV